MFNTLLKKKFINILKKSVKKGHFLIKRYKIGRNFKIGIKRKKGTHCVMPAALTGGKCRLVSLILLPVTWKTPFLVI